MLVSLVRGALTILPFRTVRSTVDQLKSVPIPLFKKLTTSHSIRSVKAASRFVPHATCLTQSLALEILLAWQGKQARTHFGVAKGPDGGLKAHAWIEADGKPLIEITADEGFTPLTASDVRAS
ncbi:MAG: lasso peptide biosynthesis B2 protein [Acidobacteriota bacterium]|nr:lasso peptide biosynthesis B2 protein [Acidobacteriota bacterium]